MKKANFIALDKTEYKDKKLEYVYQTDAYYDVELEDHSEATTLRLIKKPLGETLTKTFTSDLFPPYVQGLNGFGIEVDGTIIGFISYFVDAWNHRMRIYDFLIEAEYRRMGLGHQAMEFLKEKARNANARAIILETQTCNTKAIAFYRNEQFVFLGTDLYCYSNDDIKNKEVRLEMIYFLEN